MGGEKSSDKPKSCSNFCIIYSLESCPIFINYIEQGNLKAENTNQIRSPIIFTLDPSQKRSCFWPACPPSKLPKIAKYTADVVVGRPGIQERKWRWHFSESRQTMITLPMYKLSCFGWMLLTLLHATPRTAATAESLFFIHETATSLREKSIVRLAAADAKDDGVCRQQVI